MCYGDENQPLDMYDLDESSMTRTGPQFRKSQYVYHSYAEGIIAKYSVDEF